MKRYLIKILSVLVLACLFSYIGHIHAIKDRPFTAKEVEERLRKIYNHGFGFAYNDNARFSTMTRDEANQIVRKHRAETVIEFMKP